MDDMLRFCEEQRPGGEAAFGGVPTFPIPSAPTDWLAELRRTVERQVIPRLHKAHANVLHGQPCFLASRATIDPTDPQPTLDGRRMAIVEGTLQDIGGHQIGPHDVMVFVDRLVVDDRDGCQTCIAMHLASGLSYQRLFLDLFGAAAFRVHEMQDRDALGMAEGALAFATLASVMRLHAPPFQAEAGTTDSGHRALLVAPLLRDGCLSVFGLLLLSEFFKREGWDSWIERDFSSGVVRNLVLKEWFDLVEVLVASDQELDMVSSGIKAIRRSSRNHAISVIVCGEIFEKHPELVRAVGADSKACDPLSSLAQARLITAGPPSRGRLS